MKQRVGSVSIAVTARSWTQRFAFVLLVLLSFGIMIGFGLVLSVNIHRDQRIGRRLGNEDA